MAQRELSEQDRNGSVCGVPNRRGGRGELLTEQGKCRVGRWKQLLSYHFHGKLGFSLGCVSLFFLDIEGWGWFLLSVPQCSAQGANRQDSCPEGGAVVCAGWSQRLGPCLHLG